jgi:hypothetical protein
MALLEYYAGMTTTGGMSEIELFNHHMIPHHEVRFCDVLFRWNHVFSSRSPLIDELMDRFAFYCWFPFVCFFAERRQHGQGFVKLRGRL